MLKNSFRGWAKQQKMSQLKMCPNQEQVFPLQQEKALCPVGLLPCPSGTAG